MFKSPTQDRFTSRLSDMRRAEYGARWEPAVRYTIMAAVIVVLAFTLDSGLILGWGALYATLEAALAVILIRSDIGPPLPRYVLALIAYALSGLCFMSLPLYLVAAGQSASLTFAGVAGVVGLALYTLQRRQREIGLLTVDCGLVAAMTCALVVILWPSLDGWADLSVVCFIALSVLGYYIASQVSGWRLQRDLQQERARMVSARQSRALGQFVGGVAHEFNNDLTVILGNLELYETLDTPEDRRTAIRASRTAAARAALTVQLLLATSGRLRLSPSDVQMDGFLFDLGETLTDKLAPGMTVEVLPSREPLVARVDRAMLQSCAVQLGLNAQEATGGTGTIRLRAELRATAERLSPVPDSPPPYVALIVEDDGPGVANDSLPHLTDPFYTTKPPHEGSGLGLSAVAGFARQSGGGLCLEAGPRGGLRAIVYLAEVRDDLN